MRHLEKVRVGLIPWVGDARFKSLGLERFADNLPGSLERVNCLGTHRLYQHISDSSGFNWANGDSKQVSKSLSSLVVKLLLVIGLEFFYVLGNVGPV